MNKFSSVIEIDLAALGDNADRLAEQAGPASLMAVVKADAYGHGAKRIAGALESRVDAFAVNDVAEGIALRENGISRPILVFGVPELRHRMLYTEWDLTATVSSLSHFGLLDSGTGYHIQFDTGMGRLGILPEQAGEAKRLMEQSAHLTCLGCYSHLATADEPNSENVHRQIESFQRVREILETDLPYHLANTGGLFNFPEAVMDMVRVGIGLYGYNPGGDGSEGLSPVLRWKTHLVQVRRVRKGQTVSYGARWTCPEDGFIGTVPVGYSDGVPRSLSGKIEVRIGNTRYPMVGTVTMNYCMVWLGGDRLPESTEVVLLDRSLDAEYWAGLGNTIPYEILTGLSHSIPRRAVRGREKGGDVPPEPD